MIIARITFCALSSLALLSSLPNETLYKLEDGNIIAIQDETLMALLSHQAAVSLLYFSKSAYERDIIGLADSEINTLLRKRIQNWAPNATGFGLNWIYDFGRQCLALTAQAQASISPMSTACLENHFEDILQLLVNITGKTGYEENLASFLVVVLEGEAKLNKEFLDAQHSARRKGDARSAERFNSLVKRSDRFGQAMGTALKDLGRPEYSQGLPYVGLSRGVFIWPQDPNLVNLLSAQREAFIKWKDGLVADWSLENLVELEKSGKSARILYFDGRQLLVDVRDLTTAQLEREFAKRFEAEHGASMQARRQYLYSLWLEQHLLRRKALTQAKACDRDLSTILSSQVAEETQALRQELAQFPVWFIERSTSEISVFEALKICENQLLQDAKLLIGLCRQDGDTQGEALYTTISLFDPIQP